MGACMHSGVACSNRDLALYITQDYCSYLT